MSKKENYSTEETIFTRKDLSEYLLVGVGLFIIFLTSSVNFLLFHSVAELISIIISGGIFLIGWNSRKYMNSSFFLALGISLLFIGAIDLVHTLAYKNMGIFLENDANLPTQLWIAARYLQAISILIAILHINKEMNPKILLTVYLVVTGLIFITIFQGIFPDCFVEGSGPSAGLTPFKIYSEYIINILLFICMGLIFRKRAEFDKKVFLLIVVSIIGTIFSELAFTFYVSVFDFSNIVGHLLKILASYLVYKAIIEIGFENPFRLLFRKVKISEDTLREKAHDLEIAYSEVNQIFSASLPMRIIDVDCNVSKVNETYLSLFKVKKEDILGKKCYDVGLGHLCDTDDCSLKQIKSGKDSFEYELISELHDRTQVISIVRSVPYYLHDGTFLGIIQNFTNISERKISEEKIQKSEEKYRSLIEDSSEGVWVIDAEAITTLVNSSMAKMLGYSVDEMIGKSLYYFMDEEGKKNAEINFERRRQGIKEEHGFEFVHKTGKRVYTSLSTSPVTNAKGEFSGAMAFLTDITEERLAQEKIADMARFPSENPNPILRVSKNYVLLANKASQEIFKIGEGSKIPNQLYEIVQESFTKNENKEIELRIGNRVYNFFIIYIKETGYANIYGMNITARKKAEEDLERFVSTVSHELRTPISVLITSYDFLDNHSEKVSQDVQERLQAGIKKNVFLLKELVEDLLMLSRLDERKVELEWLEYYPYDIIREILVLMEPIGNEKNIVFNIEVDEQLTLFGDIKRITQVFRILIDNAIKYSKKNSKINISAFNNYEGKFNKSGGKGILFQVYDLGIGIRQEELPHLFERFFRSENVSNIPGTGLGLSIARELVQLHNGNIQIESEYAKGTSVFVFLPRVEKKI